MCGRELAAGRQPQQARPAAAAPRRRSAPPAASGGASRTSPRGPRRRDPRRCRHRRQWPARAGRRDRRHADAARRHHRDRRPDRRAARSARAQALGIGRIPEDRIATGLLTQSPLAHSMALPRIRQPPFSRCGLLDRGAIRRFAEDQIAASPSAPPARWCAPARCRAATCRRRCWPASWPGIRWWCWRRSRPAASTSAPPQFVHGHLPVAARRRPRPAGHQRGSRGAVPDRRPHRRDVGRPHRRRFSRRRGQHRDRRPADGRRRAPPRGPRHDPSAPGAPQQHAGLVQPRLAPGGIGRDPGPLQRPVALASADVFAAYAQLFLMPFSTGFDLEQTAIKAAPLVLTGLAVAVAFRARFWNIGGEGQLYAGAMAAAFFGTQLWLPAPLLWPAMILFGALAGAAWALLPAGSAHPLQGRRRRHHPAAQLHPALRHVGAARRAVEESAQRLSDLAADPRRRRVSRFCPAWSSCISACCWRCSPFPRSGSSWAAPPSASPSRPWARTPGRRLCRHPTARTISPPPPLSGALAGLAGVGEVGGVHYQVMADLSPGYGYTGIVIAMLARLSRSPCCRPPSSMPW